MGKSHNSGYCGTCKEDRERCDQCGATVCGCTDCRCYEDISSYWDFDRE